MGIATVGGVGYAPKLPGTAGSLVGVLVYSLMSGSIRATALAGVAAGLAGWWAGGAAEQALGAKDPGPVVIDEVCGMLLALIGVPFQWTWILASFLLFRLFDIWKPFPVRQVQAWSGGAGIMADDVLAAGYVQLCLQGGLWLTA